MRFKAPFCVVLEYLNSVIRPLKKSSPSSAGCSKIILTRFSQQQRQNEIFNSLLSFIGNGAFVLSKNDIPKHKNDNHSNSHCRSGMKFIPVSFKEDAKNNQG